MFENVLDESEKEKNLKYMNIVNVADNNYQQLVYSEKKIYFLKQLLLPQQMSFFAEDEVELKNNAI